MENENIKEKDTTKEKIILFVIGVLVGAVISTVAFLTYTKTLGAGTNANGLPPQQMSDGGTPPKMPRGESGSNNQGGTPPEKPSDDSNSQNNN